MGKPAGSLAPHPKKWDELCIAGFTGSPVQDTIVEIRSHTPFLTGFPGVREHWE
jgi:hypothetical protein